MKFDPEAEAFAELTRRPLVVVDVETTWVPGGKPQRMVSYAYAVVHHGKYMKRDAYTALVNPGVPIHAKSTNVHGITDADMAGKRAFASHAKRLARVMATPDAILVAHNANFDIGVIKNEFELIGQTMPDLPVIDTMYLPRTVGYSVEGLSIRPSLMLLCSVLGVPLLKHHDAAADTEATARIVIALLRHTAVHGKTADTDELLEWHGRGTTGAMKTSGYIPSRDLDAAYQMPPAHQVRHQVPLDSDPDAQAVADWLDRAVECAELRCPLLAAECEAAQALNSRLFKPLRLRTAGLREPGQVATLVGGLMRLLSPQCHPRVEVLWWRNDGQAIQGAPRCAGDTSCPDCRKGQPCPLDVAHEYAAQSAMCTEAGEVTQNRIEELIMKPNDGYMRNWAKSVPELAGHAAWLSIQAQVQANDHHRAGRYLELAKGFGLHKVEPQLALRVAQQFLGQGKVDDAEALLEQVLKTGSTNPSNLAVKQALSKVAVHRARQAVTAAVPVSTNRRRARPADRVRTSPFEVPTVQG